MRQFLLLGLLAAASIPGSIAETVWLQTLDLSPMRQGYGRPQVDRGITEKPLSIGGQTFEHGVGTHATSTLWIDLGGGTDRFQAAAGVDDNAGNAQASVTFKVVADGRSLWESGVMKLGQPAARVDLDVRGVKTLILMVGNGGDGIGWDHADWADARFLTRGAAPRTMAPPAEPAVILTPKPGPAPQVHGPRVHGCRPGNPFLYRIPATGERPMTFKAAGLPRGLQLEGERGIITGTVPPRGRYTITLKAANAHGRAQRKLTLVAGDRLSLTPPMGWNHWYMHYDRITDTLVRQAADVMVSSGMADVGYQYVNIDDCWMNAPKHHDPQRVGPLRDDRGRLVPNRYFPDMKALTEHVHALGLKAGIYTSPGPLTCAGFAGAYGHEADDARLFAEWGFDFLKYDWCSYDGIAKGGDPTNKNLPPWGESGGSPAALKYPYQLMGDLLKQQPRDLVFNLCQYGMGQVWEWGAEVGGHCWRTAGDLGFELDRIFEVALQNAQHAAYSKPGSWNDPDYIQIGAIGNARGSGEPIECPLTPNEQYAFMSLWCLMAAPLFYSGDMNRLDEFTLNVLCNPEVIDIDQDPIGQCARVIPTGEDTFLMVKDLDGGDKAVGLFNRGEMETTVTAKWSDLGLRGRQPVRDLWRQQELGRFAGEFSARVPRHGGVLVRVRCGR